MVEFQDKDEEGIRRASQKDKRIQDIGKALETGERKMKRVALRWCEWREGCLYYETKVWIPEDEPVRTTQIH